MVTQTELDKMKEANVDLALQIQKYRQLHRQIREPRQFRKVEQLLDRLANHQLTQAALILQLEIGLKRQRRKS